MIDPIQLPILMKAIDFVFEEGRKILEERRERRKLSDTASKSEDQEPVKVPALPEPETATEIKQDLLTSKIDELLWQNNAAEVQHLVKMLESHTKSYYILKEQSAKWGSALVPPVIMLQLEEKEDAIIEIRKQLEIVLSKVYKKDINSDK